MNIIPNGGKKNKIKDKTYSASTVALKNMT
jgi:hypothetical protein